MAAALDSDNGPGIWHMLRAARIVPLFSLKKQHRFQVEFTVQMKAAEMLARCGEQQRLIKLDKKLFKSDTKKKGRYAVES
jgi:hypothetical protein